MKNPKFLIILIVTCITIQSCAILAKTEPYYSTQQQKTIINEFSDKIKNKIKKSPKYKKFHTSIMNAESYYKQNPIKVKIGATILGTFSLWSAIKLLPKKITIPCFMASIAGLWYKFVYKRNIKENKKTETPGNTPTIVDLPTNPHPINVPKVPYTKKTVENDGSVQNPNSKVDPLTPIITPGQPPYNPATPEYQAWLLKKNAPQNNTSFTQLWEKEEYDENGNLIKFDENGNKIIPE